MTTGREYRLRFTSEPGGERPSVIVAADDASAIRIAVKLKFRPKFEIWDGARLVKAVAAGRPAASFG